MENIPVQELYQICFECGQRLSLPIESTALTIHYMHKYIHYHKIKHISIDLFSEILSSCFYLANKTIESNRPLRFIFYVVMYYFDSDILISALDHIYNKKKSKIILLENELLRILKFEVEKESPYKLILNIARFLNLKQNPLKFALMIINEALMIDRFFDISPSLLAVAGINVAINICKEKQIDYLNNHIELIDNWWNQFQIDEEKLIETSLLIVQSIENFI